MRGWLLLLLALAGSACAPPPRLKSPVAAAANPSALVAADIALSRAARERGPAAALLAAASREAVLFAPRRVAARDALKNAAAPLQPRGWQPAAVTMSCDGSAGVTTGTASYVDGRAASYAHVWLLQPDGGYRWALTITRPLPAPPATPGEISTRIASCTGQPGVPLAAPSAGDDMQVGVARDQTLRWTSTVSAAGALSLSVALWNGSGFETVPLLAEPAVG